MRTNIMRRYEPKIETLSEEQMNVIQNAFDSVFKNRIKLILHEKESDQVHVDIVILIPQKDIDEDIVIYTMGMSTEIQPDGSRSEIMITLPKNVLNPGIDVYDNENIDFIPPSVLFMEDYLYIFTILNMIAKVPYNEKLTIADTDYIELGENLNFVFRFIFAIKTGAEFINANINIFYLLSLPEDILLKIAETESYEERKLILDEYEMTLDKYEEEKE